VIRIWFLDYSWVSHEGRESEAGLRDITGVVGEGGGESGPPGSEDEPFQEVHVRSGKERDRDGHCGSANSHAFHWNTTPPH
jgi:hypothetical protein